MLQRFPSAGFVPASIATVVWAPWMGRTWHVGAMLLSMRGARRHHVFVPARSGAPSNAVAAALDRTKIKGMTAGSSSLDPGPLEARGRSLRSQVHSA